MEDNEKQLNKIRKCAPYGFQIPVKISNIDEREDDGWRRMDMDIKEGKS